MRRWAILLLSCSLLFLAPRQSNAVSKNVRTVWVTGSYGILVGAGMGLIAWPLTGGGIRTLFMGMSVGLYLGIIIGIYHNQSRNDPNNPFRNGQIYHLEPLHPWALIADTGHSQSKLPKADSPALIHWQKTVLRF